MRSYIGRQSQHGNAFSSRPPRLLHDRYIRSVAGFLEVINAQLRSPQSLLSVLLIHTTLDPSSRMEICSCMLVTSRRMVPRRSFKISSTGSISNLT